MIDSQKVYILDSFAMLAYLGGEVGGDFVEIILREATLSTNRVVLSLINWGEVAYITERERGLAKAQEVLALIEQLPIDLISVDRQSVLAAAHIKARYPVAYADAFTIAAAQALDGTIVTGDPEYKHVFDIVSIKWLGEDSTSS